MINKKTTEGRMGLGQIQIGTSSLVLIFTVLCLVIFATLSIASAKVDQKLAEKNEKYVMDYYEGDGQAEKQLKIINEKLMEFKKNKDDRLDFHAQIKNEFGDDYQQDTHFLTYQVALNKEQFLLVELEILEDGQNQENKKGYKIKKWMVQNKVDYQIDDDLPVWDGTGME